MSVTLDLVVLEGPESLRYSKAVTGGNGIDACDLLRFEPESHTLGQIADSKVVRKEPLPPHLSVVTFREGRKVETREDHYGNPLFMTTAGDLKSVAQSGHAKLKNRAVMALVHMLPDETPIILMWG